MRKIFIFDPGGMILKFSRKKIFLIPPFLGDRFRNFSFQLFRMLLVVARGAKTHKIPPLCMRRRIFVPDLERKVRPILKMIDMMNRVRLAVSVIDLPTSLTLVPIERQDLGPFA
jgi:hypothetical protein